MRVLFFAKRHRRSGITLHMRRGLEALGHEVLTLNKRAHHRALGQRLGRRWTLARARRFRPDAVLVFTFDCDTEVLESFRRDGVPIATFFDDCPHDLDERILTAARASDVFFINNRGQIPLYESHGFHVAFATGGTDPIDHRRVAPQPEFVSDIAFIGTADERGGRAEVIQALAKHFDVKVYGDDWSRFGLRATRENVYPAQYREICASARIVLGCDLRSDVELYFSNRTWLTLGCGGFLMTRYVPSLEEIFTSGKHLIWYRDTGDAVALARQWLADEPGRQRVAAEGHRFAHESYSYKKMLERMLDELTAAPASQPLP